MKQGTKLSLVVPEIKVTWAETELESVFETACIWFGSVFHKSSPQTTISLFYTSEIYFFSPRSPCKNYGVFTLAAIDLLLGNFICLCNNHVSLTSVFSLCLGSSNRGCTERLKEPVRGSSQSKWDQLSVSFNSCRDFWRSLCLLTCANADESQRQSRKHLHMNKLLWGTGTVFILNNPEYDYGVCWTLKIIY